MTIDDIDPRTRFALLKSLGGSVRAKKKLGERIRDGEVETVFKREANPEPRNTEEETRMLDSVEKSQRHAQWRQDLEKRAIAYSRQHNCSIAKAEEVLLSSEHRAEQVTKGMQAPPPGTRETVWCSATSF